MPFVQRSAAVCWDEDIQNTTNPSFSYCTQLIQERIKDKVSNF